MRSGHGRLCNYRTESSGRRAWVVAAVFLLLLEPTPAAVAVTYYVRGSGNDALDGLSPATAFATIGRASALLLDPGDRVIVGPGTYPEGNIAPRRNGTPDNPIVFQADPSGALTQDPAGPVTIVPPNVPVPPDMEDNRTGFVLFGKHDIVIEGFTIEGAADAGIQVRPHFSTSIDSTRITLRQNDIRNGRHGIQVLAVATVSIEGNLLRGHTDVGLSLTSSTEIPLRPFVRDNVIERNAYGIVLEGTSGGEVVENALVSNDIAIKLAGASDVSIRRNDLGMGRVDGGGRDLELVDNEFILEIRLDTAGTVLLQQNQIRSGVALASDPQGTLRLLDNELSSITEIRGSALLDVQGNEARVIDAVTQGAIIANGNSFAGVVRLFGTAELELNGNSAASIRAGGTRASVADNQSIRAIEIAAAVADVQRNEMERLKLFQREASGTEGPDEQSAWTVVDNSADQLLLAGTRRSPLSGAIVHGNVVGGPLQVHARGPLQVSHNEAASVACVLSETAPDLLLTNNTTRGSDSSGLIVVGAGEAIVEMNDSSDNVESGLAVRRTTNLTVTGNTFHSNGTGGIAVGTSPLLGGDCNGDGEVTVDEVVVCASIALGRLPLSECDAVDFDGDELATIDEVVRAVAGALGFVGPVPPEVRDGEVLIRANTVEDNGEFGIKVSAPGSVSVIENRVLRNGGIGVAAEVNDLRQEIEIVGNLIGSSAAEGILVSGSDQARVENNVIFSNGQGGVLLRNALGVTIANNLIYGNGNDGIAVGVGTLLPSPNAELLNNTLYSNTGWGVTIGTAGTPSEGTVILNNIFDRNGAGGIAADLESLGGLTIGFNLNNDGYSHEVTPSVTDFPADPRFVDPSGADGVLGGSGVADDDFHLDPGSAAVDAGSATAAELGITGSAVAGLDADDGIVDLGFHYGAEEPDPEPQRRPR